jgi:BirA family transcriptional regulator, biotin operon repressor / biotin---[acetyl-CoA-carboxylase] ligase
MLALAAAGEPEGLWLRAERMTAGRGRMGRTWQAPAGNLYVSTIVRLGNGDPAPATLGFVAAIALVELLAGYASEAEFRIKWPNDVLASGAKISGILLERNGDAVVVGIGVNLAAHPQNLDRPVTSVKALTGSAPDTAQFLEDLTQCFARWVSRWRGEGLGEILKQWHALAHPIGVELQVSLPQGGQFNGLFDGLDCDGALKLRLADGSVRVIHAGDAFLV